jgi:hypothetical protein
MLVNVDTSPAAALVAADRAVIVEALAALLLDALDAEDREDQANIAARNGAAR